MVPSVSNATEPVDVVVCGKEVYCVGAGGPNIDPRRLFCGGLGCGIFLSRRRFVFQPKLGPNNLVNASELVGLCFLREFPETPEPPRYGLRVLVAGLFTGLYLTLESLVCWLGSRGPMNDVGA